MTGRVWKFVAAACFIPVLAGCGCTSAGCGSAVAVNNLNVASLNAVGAIATLCAEGVCHSSVLEKDTVGLIVPVNEGRSAGDVVDTTLRIARGDTVLVDSRSPAVLIEVTPNGPRCAPVCTSVVLEIRDGKLFPSAPE